MTWNATLLRTPIGVLLALLLALPAASLAQAGRVQFVAGDVRLVTKDGASRAAQRLDPVFEGDMIVTGAYAMAQLRMSDDGLIAVRPDTQLRIDTYVYAGREDGTERGVLGLLRGGFRTITGVIGRTNRANYLVRTPNATIGIRGTDHEPMFIPVPAQGETPVGEPGTYNKVNVGETFIEAGGRRIELGANQAGFASLVPGVPPVRLDRIPGFMRATLAQQGRDERRAMREAAQSDQRRLSSAQAPAVSAAATAVTGSRTASTTDAQPAFVQQSTSQLTLQEIASTRFTPAPEGYLGVGADLSPTSGAGSGAIQVGVGGAAMSFGADGNPALITSGGGFQYARAGAPLVDSGALTFVDGGKPIEVRWGIYAGGAAIDRDGPRTTTFFQFMTAPATPDTVVANLTASYSTPFAATKLVTESGALGGTIQRLDVSISGGQLTGYSLAATDAAARNWSASCLACSNGVALTTFRDSGAVLAGSVSAGATASSQVAAGRAQGYPIGSTGSAFLSSFVLRTVDGKTVTGTAAVK